MFLFNVYVRHANTSDKVNGFFYIKLMCVLLFCIPFLYMFVSYKVDDLELQNKFYVIQEMDYERTIVTKVIKSSTLTVLQRCYKNNK